MNRLLELIGRETREIHTAAYVLAACALLSQLLALVRDHLLASVFGVGGVLDVYYAAFRVPDLLFAAVASLLSLYALMPVLSRLEAQHPDLVVSFMRRTLAVFFVGLGLIAAVVFLLAPYLLPWVAPGIARDPVAAAQWLLLTRILLLQPILLGASNILANLTQLRHRFILYSVSPLLYNFGIIAGVLLLYPVLGIAGLGWGVVLGAALHVLVQVPFFAAQRSKEYLSWRVFRAHLREVLALSIPRTLALSAGQLSLVVLVALATTLATGSVAVFSFAYNLQAVPLTIIGVSYSVAAFPTLARLFAAGKREEFLNHIEQALRHIAFWALPATVLVIVLRAQLVRVILGSGTFDWSATRLTAAALALFVISLFAQSAMLVIARAYYAAGATKKPLFLAVLSVAVSVVSAYALVSLFGQSPALRLWLAGALRVAPTDASAVLMLALGYSIGSLVQCGFGIVIFARDFALSLRALWRLLWQSALASVAGGVVAYVILALVVGGVDQHTVFGVFLQGFVAGLAGLAVTGLVLYMQGNRELFEIAQALHRRFRTVPVAVEPTDLEV